MNRGGSGISLIHTMAMIVVIGSLSTLSMSIIYQAYASHQKAVDHINDYQRLNLLRERFSGDANRSSSAEAGKDLVLSFGGAETITYQVEGEQVTRTHVRDGIELGSGRWLLPGPATSEWQLDESGALPLLEWRMSWEVGDLSAPMRAGLESNGWSTPRRSLRWLSRVGVFSSDESVSRGELVAEPVAEGGNDGSK